MRAPSLAVWVRTGYDEKYTELRSSGRINCFVAMYKTSARPRGYKFELVTRPLSMSSFSISNGYSPPRSSNAAGERHVPSITAATTCTTSSASALSGPVIEITQEPEALEIEIQPEGEVIARKLHAHAAPV